MSNDYSGAWEQEYNLDVELTEANQELELGYSSIPIRHRLKDASGNTLLSVIFFSETSNKCIAKYPIEIRDYVNRMDGYPNMVRLRDGRELNSFLDSKEVRGPADYHEIIKSMKLHTWQLGIAKSLRAYFMLHSNPVEEIECALERPVKDIMAFLSEGIGDEVYGQQGIGYTPVMT